MNKKLPIINKHLFERIDNRNDAFYKYENEPKFIEEFTYLSSLSDDLFGVTVHNIHVGDDFWKKEGLEIVWNADPFKLIKINEN